MQDGIEIQGGIVGGNLKYLTDYTGYSEEVGEQGGNYLALRFAVPGVGGCTITVQIIGGTDDPITPNADGIAVFRITDEEQAIEVCVTKERCYPVVKTYLLSSLVLEKIAVCGTRYCGEE